MASPLEYIMIFCYNSNISENFYLVPPTAVDLISIYVNIHDYFNLCYAVFYRQKADIAPLLDVEDCAKFL